MNYWFVKLGSSKDLASRMLNEDFAKNHSLVKIGYGIDRDISMTERYNVRRYLEVRNRRIGLEMTRKEVFATARMIDTFKHHIRIGDKIICPFGDSPEKLMMGEVISYSNTIASFFKGKEKELADIIARHPDSDEQGTIEVKPALQVKWQDEELDLNAHPQLKKALSKPMRELVNELKLTKRQPLTILRNLVTILIIASIVGLIGYIYKTYF